MKNLSQISVILMKNLSHFGHLRLAGMDLTIHGFDRCNLYIHLRRSRNGASVRPCVRASVHPCVRVSFSSLWAAFTLTVHINALYNESVQRQEQHSSGMNTIT